MILPKRFKERIKKESKIPEEELISKALSEFFKEPLDPESKVELHLKLCEKFLKELRNYWQEETLFKLLKRLGVQHLK